MFVVGVNPVLHADQVPAGFPARDRLLAALTPDTRAWRGERTGAEAPIAELKRTLPDVRMAEIFKNLVA